VDSRARISSTARWILFSTSEYVLDILYTTVIDESIMWAGDGCRIFLIVGLGFWLDWTAPTYRWERTRTYRSAGTGKARGVNVVFLRSTSGGWYRIPSWGMASIFTVKVYVICHRFKDLILICHRFSFEKVRYAIVLDKGAVTPTTRSLHPAASISSLTPAQPRIGEGADTLTHRRTLRTLSKTGP
jgi:hypothetical protein